MTTAVSLSTQQINQLNAYSAAGQYADGYRYLKRQMGSDTIFVT